jgi:hypothetical protein
MHYWPIDITKIRRAPLSLGRQLSFLHYWYSFWLRAALSNLGLLRAAIAMIYADYRTQPPRHRLQCAPPYHLSLAIRRYHFTSLRFVFASLLASISRPVMFRCNVNNLRLYAIVIVDAEHNSQLHPIMLMMMLLTMTLFHLSGCVSPSHFVSSCRTLRAIELNYSAHLVSSISLPF